MDEKTKGILADFLNEIRDYITESSNNLVHDERSSSEFVDIYCKDWKGEKADYNNEAFVRRGTTNDVKFADDIEPPKHGLKESEAEFCPECNSENIELIKLYSIWFCKDCCSRW